MSPSESQPTVHSSPGNLPVVSIVMPAYNAERWIANAIDSVLGQTYSDWELLVVDDGSSDDTEAVVRGYDDPRISLISQANRGPYHSRNTGLKQARGKYIALLDADDWYEPVHLRLATEFLDRHPQCSLVGDHAVILLGCLGRGKFPEQAGKPKLTRQGNGKRSKPRGTRKLLRGQGR